MTIRWGQLGATATLMAMSAIACAQRTAPVKSPAAATSQTKTKLGESVQTEVPKLPVVQGEQVDRIVAIVNGDLILDSDVNQEQRFQELLPYGENGATFSREKAIERLINRALILQQAKLQPEESVSDDDAQKDIIALRKQIPSCQMECQNDAGWKKFLDTHGFTTDEFFQLWKQRMEVLAFIQERFQLGIKITPDQVKTYYETKMLPVYSQKGVKPPPLTAISTRIQDVLLQQQVSGLLNDWLNSLRSQGSIVVLHPGEGAP